MNLYSKQKEDLARAALHDGLIFSWDTGCGKTLAAYLWSLLKVGSSRSDDPPAFSGRSSSANDPKGVARPRVSPASPVLIIGPTDGFEHFEDEGAKLGIELIALDSQEKFYRLWGTHAPRVVVSAPSPKPLAHEISQSQLRSAFYYTTYTQLTRNGVAKFPTFSEWKSSSSRNRGRDSENEDENEQSLHAAYRAAKAGLGEFRKINGRPIHCVYSPTLADLIAGQFDCVVVDEGVHMKGAATQVGTGIRQLTPRFRLVLTATPIKNRLPDVFYLAAWAAGVDEEPNARWPYRNDPEEQTAFAENFLIAERNLTKERQAEAAGKRRRFKKLSAEVCNVHGLWKLFAPIVLRRRKKDFEIGSTRASRVNFGAPAEIPTGIPPKHCHVIRVPMGRAQAAVYAYHLHARYLDKNKKPAHGAKLQALRVAAANPCSGLLKEVNHAPF